MSPAVPTAWWVRIPVALALALAVLVAPGMIGAAHAAPAAVNAYSYDSRTEQALDGTLLEVFAVDPAIDPGATPLTSATTINSSAGLDFEEGTVWIRVSRPGYLTQVTERTFGAGWGSISFYLDVDPDHVGTLTGKVVDQQGKNIANRRGRVEFHQVSSNGDFAYITGHTGASGTYTAQLPAGDYRVMVSDDDDEFASVWVGGTSWETARTLSVAGRSTTTAPTATLRPAPKVSGTVKDTAGKAIRNARVEAYTTEHEWDPYTWTTTSKGGTFALTSLPAGTFRLRFIDPHGQYLGEWYDDQADFETAKTITLAKTDVVANAVLADAPVADAPFNLTGSVRDSSGSPVRTAVVEAYRKVTSGSSWYWEAAGEAFTSRTGRYTFTDLEPATYSVRVRSGAEGGDEFEPQWYGGKFNDRTAKTIVVPATGAVTADPLTVVLNGTLSGLVSQPDTANRTGGEIYVDVYDADGRYVNGAEARNGGEYAIRGLAPGVYTLRAYGHQYISTEINSWNVDLVSQWWRNAYSEATSTKVRVAPDGDVTGIDFTLSASLANVAKPAISGTGAYGTRLTATPGTWNRSANTVFGYQWTRNGAAISGATKATYTTTAADLGRQVAVKVTATDKYDLLTAGSATSAAKVVKGKATIGVSAKGARKSATVKVRLGLQGVSAAQATGTVRIYDGKKLKKTVTVRRGSTSVNIRGLKRGKHTLTVKFAGSGSHTAASASKRVTVKK